MRRPGLFYAQTSQQPDKDRQVTASAVRAIQFSLFDEDFNLDEEQRAFVAEYLANGGDRIAAMLKIRPRLTRSGARDRSYAWLGAEPPTEKYPGNPEIRRYLSWKQAQIRLHEHLTETELVGKARRIYLHAVGDAPLRKTLVSRDGGMKDRDVYEPNLGAANTAVETLRKLGGFGRDLVPAQTAPVFTAKERAARLAALLDRGRRELPEEAMSRAS